MVKIQRDLFRDALVAASKKHDSFMSFVLFAVAMTVWAFTFAFISPYLDFVNFELNGLLLVFLGGLISIYHAVHSWNAKSLRKKLVDEGKSRGLSATTIQKLVNEIETTHSVLRGNIHSIRDKRARELEEINAQNS